MSNVVGLDGREVKTQREPNENAMAIISNATNLVCSGEVTGVAIIYLHSDGVTSGQYGGEANYAMVGRMEELKLALLREFK